MQTNTAMGDYLCVGDYVGLYSVETEGYVYSLQSRFVCTCHDYAVNVPNNEPNSSLHVLTCYGV